MVPPGTISAEGGYDGHARRGRGQKKKRLKEPGYVVLVSICLDAKGRVARFNIPGPGVTMCASGRARTMKSWRISPPSWLLHLLALSRVANATDRRRTHEIVRRTAFRTRNLLLGLSRAECRHRYRWVQSDAATGVPSAIQIRPLLVPPFSMKRQLLRTYCRCTT